MAWTTQKWLNLRSTIAYVTDAAGQVAVTNENTDLPAYPKSITLDGDTFSVGWASSVDGSRDRTTGYDPRLAGIHFGANSAGSPSEFRIDLLGGTGTYEIRIASGDPVGLGTTQPNIKIYDDATLRATIDGTAGITDFMDATGVNYTSTNWPGSNSAVSLTFSSTSGTGGTPILRIKCGDTATAGNTALNAIGIMKIAGGATYTPRMGLLGVG